jgi:hypothetical protein
MDETLFRPLDFGSPAISVQDEPLKSAQNI